jgi:hypothetical protein
MVLPAIAKPVDEFVENCPAHFGDRQINAVCIDEIRGSSSIPEKSTALACKTCADQVVS